MGRCVRVLKDEEDLVLVVINLLLYFQFNKFNMIVNSIV